jgi:hypothetical protein
MTKKQQKLYDDAMLSEKLGDRALCIAIAEKLLKISKKVPIGKFVVDTWFDRQSRNWITSTLDQNGNEVSDNHFNGHVSSAAYAHLWAIEEARRGKFGTDYEELLKRYGRDFNGIIRET